MEKKAEKVYRGDASLGLNRGCMSMGFDEVRRCEKISKRISSLTRSPRTLQL